MAIDRDRAFFSYSREDSQFALRLAADLKASSANVWVDQLDITPGKRWDSSVEEALKTSPSMLVILSPASVKSTNVQDEVAFALEEEKNVVPVLYRDCTIPFRLRRLQYVDFREDYDSGLNRLIKILTGERGPEASAPSEEPRESKEADTKKTTVANAVASAPVARLWPINRRVAVLAGVLGLAAVLYFATRSPQVAPSSRVEAPQRSQVTTGSVPEASKVVSGAPNDSSIVPKPRETPRTGPKETGIDNSPERYYLGRHDLRVNRVGDSWGGSVNITSTDGTPRLVGAIRSGAYYLELSGTVELIGPRQFFLTGEISGIPDLSFRNAAPKVGRTVGRFMFNAYPGGGFWRMHSVNGVNCVCDDNCGNDFCYIDIASPR